MILDVREGRLRVVEECKEVTCYRALITSRYP